MSLNSLRVRDLMTDEVISIGPGDSLLTVQELMWNHDIRHLPVVDDDNELVGLVSQRDLVRVTQSSEVNLPLSAQADMLRSTSVDNVMIGEVATAEPEEDIRVAAQLMVENKFGCLPIVSGGQVVGILTESDFVRFLAQGD